MRASVALGVALALMMETQGAVVPEPVNGYAPCSVGEGNVTCHQLMGVEFPGGMLLYSVPSDSTEQLTCPTGYFFPMFPTEYLWDKTARSVFYFVVMIWLFLGVAIISDKFMEAIEVITAKKRTVVAQDENGHAIEKTLLVWDPTVANLTLMALGSSAPEILLAIIETVGTMNEPPADGLGPSCIVGSAVFNMFMITAVCLVSVPKGESRSIDGYVTFSLTAFFSVWAYVWMYIVLLDEMVYLWEALLTLFFFPLLVTLCWLQNTGKLFKESSSSKVYSEPESASGVLDNFKNRKVPRSNDAVLTVAEQQNAKVAMALSTFPPDISDEEKAKRLADAVFMEEKTTMNTYRLEARKRLGGSRGIFRGNSLVNRVVRRLARVTGSTKTWNDGAQGQAGDTAEPAEPASTTESKAAGGLAQPYPAVSFSSSEYQVNESAGFVEIAVQRSGTAEQLQHTSVVQYETRSGEARAGEDFEHTLGVLTFAPGETDKTIRVTIINDNVYEPDEKFYVELRAATKEHCCDLESAKNTLCTVTIIDDDKPGTFGFPDPAIVVRETSGIAHCKVRRSNGCAGVIKVSYKTKDITAKAGVDYYSCSGTLVFDANVAEQNFQVTVVDTKSYDQELHLAVELLIENHPECGAEYGQHRVLGITITSDEEYEQTVDRVSDLMRMHLEEAEVGTEGYYEQLCEALTLSGEDGEAPSLVDCVLHILSFAFKLVFVIVPPTKYLDGLPAFFASLVIIGFMTMLIGDVAEIFGCLVGIPAPLTALTLVAMGTSLPDTFASMLAAKNEKNADNSIGNITGSNSVNVFLGLGLPWTIATVYKVFVKGEEGYRVKSGSLSIAVVSFLVVACVYFAVMYLRRVKGFGELGGPWGPKVATAALFTLLWAGFSAFVGASMLNQTS